MRLAPRSGEEQPLRAVLRWRGAALDARVIAPDELLSIGHGRHVTFDLPEGDGRYWVAAACLDGAWHVALDAPARAMNADDDRPLLSAEARTDGPDLPRGFVAGKLWAPISEGAHVRLVAGALSIELERCNEFTLARIERPPRWATPEGQGFIIAMLVAACLVAMIRITPHDSDDDQRGLGPSPDIIARVQPRPIAEDANDKLIRWRKDHVKPDNAGSEKARGIEGEAGRPDAPRREARRAGPKTDAEVVRDQAIFKMLTSGTTAQLLAGGSLSAANALGHLAGPTVGDAQGALGTRNSRSSGSGGGGLERRYSGRRSGGHEGRRARKGERRRQGRARRSERSRHRRAGERAGRPRPRGYPPRDPLAPRADSILLREAALRAPGSRGQGPRGVRHRGRRVGDHGAHFRADAGRSRGGELHRLQGEGLDVPAPQEQQRRGGDLSVPLQAGRPGSALMRAWKLLLLVAMCAPLTVWAEVPFSLGVGAGVMTDTGPWRPAPSLAFNGALGLPGDHFALIARLDGWTFASLGPVPANSELTAAIGASYSAPIARGFFWTAGAAPAVSFLSRPGVSMETRPGLMLLPAIGLATRRRTLAVQLGGEALLSLNGVRSGAVAGVVYTFR